MRSTSTYGQYNRRSGEHIWNLVLSGSFRLARPTLIHPEGWIRLLPLSQRFKQYGVNNDRIRLEYTEVSHPYNEALNEGYIITMIYGNHQLNDYSHEQVIVLYDQDDTNYLALKYPDKPFGEENVIKIKKDLPIYPYYRTFWGRSARRKLFIGECGLYLKFKLKDSDMNSVQPNTKDVTVQSETSIINNLGRGLINWGNYLFDKK